MFVYINCFNLNFNEVFIIHEKVRLFSIVYINKGARYTLKFIFIRSIFASKN